MGRWTPFLVGCQQNTHSQDHVRPTVFVHVLACPLDKHLLSIFHGLDHQCGAVASGPGDRLLYLYPSLLLLDADLAWLPWKVIPPGFPLPGTLGPPVPLPAPPPHSAKLTPLHLRELTSDVT